MADDATYLYNQWYKQMKMKSIIKKQDMISKSYMLWEGKKIIRLKLIDNLATTSDWLGYSHKGIIVGGGRGLKIVDKKKGTVGLENGRVNTDAFVVMEDWRLWIRWKVGGLENERINTDDFIVKFVASFCLLFGHQ